MRKLAIAVAFAVLVTLGALALDMLLHAASGTAVTLDKFIIKTIITFATVALVAAIVGYGKVPGAVSAVVAALAFYIHAVIALPTIAFGQAAAFAIALGVAYWLAFMRVMRLKKTEKLSFAVTVALATLALHWGWMLFIVTLAGNGAALSFGMAAVVLVILFVLAFLATLLKSWWPGIVAGAVLGALALSFGAAWLDAVVRFVTFSGMYLLAYVIRGEA